MPSRDRRRRKRIRKQRVEDSRLVRLVERVPVLGFVVSAGHGVSSFVTGER